jgi:hypothetical protein
MTFRFLGSESLIGDSIRLNRWGQSVDLSEPQAVNAILGGCALLDAETFDALGFEKQDLDKFAGIASHGRAPAEFLEKKKAALVAAHALCERLESGGAFTAVVPQQE